tara:strand:- start:5726 stop:6163 length:438 start_codon:yes stop_codon:yes gene_type:complete
MKDLKRYNKGISIINREKFLKIISIVNKFYEVDCLQNSRITSIVEPRQIATYYTHKLTDLSTTSVGLLFNKTHATVLSSISVIEGRILFDKEFKKQIPKLEELIFRINFKTEDEFLLFKAKEEINELMSKMTLNQCNELIENIKN